MFMFQCNSENANEDDRRRSTPLTAALLDEEDDEGGGQEGHPKGQVEPYLEAQVLPLVLCQLSWVSDNSENT